MHDGSEVTVGVPEPGLGVALWSVVRPLSMWVAAVEESSAALRRDPDGVGIPPEARRIAARSSGRGVAAAQGSPGSAWDIRRLVVRNHEEQNGGWVADAFVAFALRPHNSDGSRTRSCDDTL